jgi:hypothetical protein
MNKLIQLMMFCMAGNGFVLHLQAQRNCGTPNSYEYQQQFKQQYLAEEQKIARFIAEKNAMPLQTQAVRTIPVVVHILYNNNTTDPTYVSDAKIISQLIVLNQDFRRQNADWTSTPNVWQGLVADCEVRFCLASRDPSGNPTSGIIRVKTDSVNFFLRNSPKSNATGGSSGWPSNKYLNVWVVPRINSGSELLGYATFPWMNAGANDGVVIRFNAFGNIAPLQASYNLGRTTTHEVGHWLGLKHTWGDENACAADDEVSDTPLEKQAIYGCPSFPNTDSCTNSGNGVMFMNYMDYVDDRCMYMFTNGQKNRMNYYLANDRKSVADNANAGCGDCPYNLSLSGNLGTNTVYRTAETIFSVQQISNGRSAEYKAGQTITLAPGFIAANGCNFRAIAGEICFPPF